MAERCDQDTADPKAPGGAGALPSKAVWATTCSLQLLPAPVPDTAAPPSALLKGTEVHLTALS
jgi:hypothetical protein